jgi:GAF domain-containing protein
MIKYFRSLWPSYIPAGFDLNDEIAILRERIFQAFALFSFFVSIIVLVLVIPTYLAIHQWSLIAVYGVCLIVLGAAALIRSIPYRLRATSVLIALYFVGAGSLFAYGMSGNGPVLLTVFIGLSAIFMGTWAGVVAGVAVLGTMLSLGMLMSLHVINPPPVDVQANSAIMVEWIIRSMVVTLMGSVLIMGLTAMINGLRKSGLTQKALAQDLKIERDSLEARVAQRTGELEKRASAMELASQIARDIAEITDLDELLTHAVEVIKDEFHLYYAAIFLLDDRKEYAVLRSGTGEAGKVMLAMNHRLKLDETSMVGFALTRREYRLSQEVDKDPVHYKNPQLPETQSELALPLFIGNDVIGCLNVQSTTPGYFMPDDIHTLQIATDQLAVAIEKASLVTQLTAALEDLRASYRQSTQQSWQNFMYAARRPFSYRYQHGNIEAVTSSPLSSSKVLRSGDRSVTQQVDSATGKSYSSVEIPIKLRDQVLGVLHLRFEAQNLPSNLVDMLEIAASRLALALENARLLEEIQMRANRDHLVSNISAKVRAETDVDHILRTVASELGRSLGVSDVLVQLRGNES